jgi:hypothetical protein
MVLKPSSATPPETIIRPPGLNALYSNTTGIQNTANGAQTLFSNTTGTSNTATGLNALYSNTTGNYNTANGAQVLFSNTTGRYNTATGVSALSANTTGNSNTAYGFDALLSNTSGGGNTATGVEALYHNTTGLANTANGFDALFRNTIGFGNTAIGENALTHNTTGNHNTANGGSALYSNTTGANNTASGVSALLDNIIGAGNTASGFEALYNNTGSWSIGLGYQAGKNLTTGARNIDIGNGGVAGESSTIRIGDTQYATYIAGISGKTATGGAAVFVTASGKLGTVTSSRRFKKDIADMDAASEALLALHPVTFRYKPELDKAGIPQYGLVAEEVAEVNPDLVVRDEKGEIYTVRYEAVNAMLLNEFLKEHRKVQELEANAVQQQRQIEALTAGLQKVSAQLEVNKSAPQTVLNSR